MVFTAYEMHCLSLYSLLLPSEPSDSDHTVQAYSKRLVIGMFCELLVLHPMWHAAVTSLENTVSLLPSNKCYLCVNAIVIRA